MANIRERDLMDIKLTIVQVQAVVASTEEYKEPGIAKPLQDLS